jgi:hypothetical protein
MIAPRHACLFIILILFSFSSQSQENLKLSRLEDSLSSLQRKIMKADNDSAKQSLNIQFHRTLKTAIGLPGSFAYPFDSIKKMAILTSPDKMFRIYNWNLPAVNGSNRYFCFLQVQDKNKKNCRFIELLDRSDSIPDPEHAALGECNWYGALYYKILSEKTQSGMIYTFLGWHGNPVETQKVIEILWFDDKGIPHFGKKIFNKYKDSENKRIIFRFSSLATMVLRYEEQSLSGGKKWNSSRRRFEETLSRSAMIVCDRLVTVDASEGKGTIIAPAGDIYDGFIFENGRWNFVEGVDARNR